MSDTIGSRIIALKNEFADILFLKQETSQLFEKSKDKIKKLQEWYNNYIDENHNHLFIFGLDSFHYQGKIIDVEYDDMTRLYSSITNRIYCEYYKLYQIIVQYTEQVVKDKKVEDVVKSNNHFPKYQDLEPYKQYGTETITQLHDVIMLLFTSVKNVIDKKHEELDVHRLKNKIGINIDNFIQAFHFEIMIMEQKLMLFISYMEFFHKMNLKYLKRFTGKMDLFSSQIDHDIRIDSHTKTKERRKTMIEGLKQDNINAELINELAESIASTSDEETNNKEPNNKKIEGARFHYKQLHKPPTIIITDNEQASFFDNVNNQERENTYDDETNTTQDDETDLNIRKRLSSVNCVHGGNKICSCAEKETTCKCDEEPTQSFAAQILFGMVDEPENDDNTTDSPEIVGDLTKCEFSLNSLTDADAPTMDNEKSYTNDDAELVTKHEIHTEEKEEENNEEPQVDEQPNTEEQQADEQQNTEEQPADEEQNTEEQPADEEQNNEEQQVDEQQNTEEQPADEEQNNDQEEGVTFEVQE